MNDGEYYGVYMKLNPEKDKDIIDYLELNKKLGGKTQTLFKRLIREVISRNDRNKLDGGNYSNDHMFNIDHYLE